MTLFFLTRPSFLVPGIVLALCSITSSCNTAPKEKPPGALPGDLVAIEDWTESEEYSWLVERCVKTTQRLYFVEDDTLSGLISLEPERPELDGFTYTTIPSLDPDEFIPGRSKLFGKPVTAMLPAGTEFRFDQVFVTRTRISTARWHFVAPVTFEDGATRRVDFTYGMGRAARKSDYGTPLEQMAEGLEFFLNELSFCEEVDQE